MVIDFSYMQACKAILEEIFWPTESESSRLRSAVFEMQLSYGVLCSPFKPFLLFVLNQFTNC